MKFPLSEDLIAVTRLTRHGRLGEATAAIRRLLSRRAAPGAKPSTPPPPAYNPAPPPPETRREAAPVQTVPRPSDPFAAPTTKDAPIIATGEQGQFLTCSFANAVGSRPYRLYVPACYQGQPTPLLVMLHGCTQSPEDFAAGTRMHVAAEAAGCLVAYPGQTKAANQQKCWNWFNPADQARDGGEPALIVGIVRQIMDQYAVDPSRVYVAGLSAGGAASDVLAARFPELFAAVGVHSGLACGAAHDLASAFAAMQHGGAGRTQQRLVSVPTIVFHGDRDAIVNPRNADSVVTQALPGEELQVESIKGRVPGGHSYTRTRYRNATGNVVIERWVVHGGGHAWFGGDPSGSYTDPLGPDATGEMLGFFLSHRRATC